MKLHLIIPAVGLFALAASPSSHAQVVDPQFAVASNLRAGATKVDITPAEVVGITVVGHRREVTGVRDPLRAGVLILDDGETKAAIVTMDTIGAWDDMVKLARIGIEKETGVPAANIMVSASHNHSGPGYEENAHRATEITPRPFDVRLVRTAIGIARQIRPDVARAALHEHCRRLLPIDHLDKRLRLAEAVMIGGGIQS